MRNRRGPRPETRIKLTPSERKKLRKIIRKRTAAQRDVQRAELLLQLHADPCVTEASRATGLSESTVRRLRRRFLEDGRLNGLNDRPRSGRPVEIDSLSRCLIVAMACGEPGDFGEPFRDIWTVDSLFARFRALHPQRQMSRTAVVRILNAEHLRPQRVKMWLHSPDPKFREKVTDICKLYLAPPPGAIVLCVDEKTGMQALGRKHPGRPPAPGRDRRKDYEYVRNGTRKLLAAFAPHSGEVYAESREGRTADDLMQFMEKIATFYPDQQVHIVWDNLNIHHDGPEQRWTKFNERHGGRFHFHYTPIHASWVNQVELFFGVLQRRVLRHGVFDTLEALDDAVIGFIDHWNKNERHPFNWTFKGYRSRRAKRAA